jgi:PDDEXK-like domain of unknown function (DUF3799)
MNIKQFKRGQIITEPGIYANVPIDVYHGANLCDGPSISSSGLRTLFNESPAHYWAKSPYNPDREPEADNEAFVLGRAAHHLLLGEDDFSTLFIMRPEMIEGEAWQGNKKICKAWIETQKAAGRTVLTPNQINQIRGMAKSLAANTLVKVGLLNGLIEHSMVWKCKDTGIWKKARPDVIPNFSGDYADLKTTPSVQFEDVMRSLADFGYCQQGALVCEGHAALIDKGDTTFSLAFVEKNAPYAVRISTLWHEDLARGEQQNYAAAEIFKNCMSENHWPGPADDDAQFLPLPDWKRKQIDTKLEQLMETK